LYDARSVANFYSSVLSFFSAYLFRGDSYIRSPAVEITSIEEDKPYYHDSYCPIHGSRKRFRRPQLKDVGSYHLTSIESVEMEPTSHCIFSQAYAAKMIRKRKRATLSGVARFRNRKEKHKIEMNLWIMSVAFLFLFTAFHGLQNLQTSVNKRLGFDSLGVYYLTVAISSLFVPPFMLNRLGCKLTLIVSSGIYMIYMVANFLPKYYSLIPAAILAGCAGSCLFATKCVYISESGRRFGQLNVEDQNVVTVRFFGFFFTVLHFGQVVGNVLSSFILTLAIEYVKPADGVIYNTLRFSNSPFLSEQAKANLKQPPRGAFLALCGAYFCCTVVALLIVSMFLNSLRKDKIASKMQCKINYFPFNLRCLNYQIYLPYTYFKLSNAKPLLLTPLTIFNGLEQAFLIGYYTKAYVACGLGISQIGYVVTSFGIADALCSLFFGPLMKLFGRMPLFVFGAVVNMLTIMTLMIWPLNPGDTELFYVIAGVWGMADGVWNTQLNGLWVVLSRSSLEAAFANYHFWECSGIAFGLFLTRFANISQVLIICLIVLLIGITGYFIVEFYEEFTASILSIQLEK
uniref:UNC93-like protein n=1 Tax=Enterobius vermicularis TaxID=51028 RepID=A0A0N4VJU7_ENTVE